MDWRVYQPHGDSRGAEFYGTALEYGHYLWMQKLPARAILCLDRAMGAGLKENDPVLGSWPIPYAAMAWILREVPRDLFCGNPRVHFQHYSDRLSEPRKMQRKWRGWACWALVRRIRPELAGDPDCGIREPTEIEIGEGLIEFGHLNEVEKWESVLEGAF